MVLLVTQGAEHRLCSVHQHLCPGCFWRGVQFWETLLALFMHLIPTFILVAVIAIAWRWERVGAALFLALALIYLSMTDGRMLTIPIPLIIVSLLFLVSWRVTLKPR